MRTHRRCKHATQNNHYSSCHITDWAALSIWQQLRSLCLAFALCPLIIEKRRRATGLAVEEIWRSSRLQLWSAVTQLLSLELLCSPSRLRRRYGDYALSDVLFCIGCWCLLHNANSISPWIYRFIGKNALKTIELQQKKTNLRTYLFLVC